MIKLKRYYSTLYNSIVIGAGTTAGLITLASLFTNWATLTLSVFTPIAFLAWMVVYFFIPYMPEIKRKYIREHSSSFRKKKVKIAIAKEGTNRFEAYYKHGLFWTHYYSGSRRMNQSEEEFLADFQETITERIKEGKEENNRDIIGVFSV